MAITISTAASRLTAAAANVATQMGGGTTTAEVQAIAEFLLQLSRRNDLAINAMQIANQTTIKQLLLA